MEVDETTNRILTDTQIDVKLKLAAVWTAFMFFYIYVDYFTLYKPGTLAEIQSGSIFMFEITQTFLMAGLVLVSIPMLMVVLSVMLPPRLNRWLNIVVALVYVPVSLFNLLGESYAYLYYGAGIEVVLLGLVVWYAWNWPRTPEAASSPRTPEASSS
jgi:membrane-bound metal-dependent hydrolase YbcI (DUF457 family)